MALQSAPDLIQSLAQWNKQIERFGGRRHPALGWDEKGITECIPKTVQLRADGGLAQMKSRCSLRHVSLCEQSFEGHQQIKINAIGIHHLDCKS